jgi:hypothetical protein
MDTVHSTGCSPLATFFFLPQGMNISLHWSLKFSLKLTMVRPFPCTKTFRK